jgi:hypothetical protein
MCLFRRCRVRHHEHMSEIDDASPRAQGRRFSPIMLGLIAVVVVVVAVALIAVFVRGGDETYPADSPEGVVQRYARAVVDGDTDAALGYLTPDSAADCERWETGSADYRITLVRRTVRDSTARVEVIVSEVVGGGPFGPDEYQNQEVFSLQRIDGDWKVENMPWQFRICAEEARP